MGLQAALDLEPHRDLQGRISRLLACYQCIRSGTKVGHKITLLALVPIPNDAGSGGDRMAIRRDQTTFMLEGICPGNLRNETCGISDPEESPMELRKT